MTRKEFFDLQPLAIFGVSSRGSGFGVVVFKELNKLEIKCFAVNPKGGKTNSLPIYPTLADLPEKARAAVILTKGEGAIHAVEECSRQEVSWVWLQGGSDRPEVNNLCRELGINVFRGECIMMRRGRFPHSLHRFLHDLFKGK
jgi:predicted CoA-binding protein